MNENNEKLVKFAQVLESLDRLYPEMRKQNQIPRHRKGFAPPKAVAKRYLKSILGTQQESAINMIVTQFLRNHSPDTIYAFKNLIDREIGVLESKSRAGCCVSSAKMCSPCRCE